MEIAIESLEFSAELGKKEKQRLLASMLNSHDRPIGSETSDHLDIRSWPMGELPFSWEELNQDFGSNPFNYRDVSEIASSHREELLDLRLIMIERPFIASTMDKFPKVLNIFRQMQLR